MRRKIIPNVLHHDDPFGWHENNRISTGGEAAPYDHSQGSWGGRVVKGCSKVFAAYKHPVELGAADISVAEAVSSSSSSPQNLISSFHKSTAMEAGR